MKWQFIILISRLPQVLEVYIKTGGYLEVERYEDLGFAIVTSDNLSLLYHEDFKDWPCPLIPFREQGECKLKVLQKQLDDVIADRPDDIDKWDKVEIESTSYLDEPIEGKLGRTVNTIKTCIKVGGEEVYREILSDQEYISDKSILRQFYRFLEEVKTAKMLRGHPCERHVLSAK